MLLLGAREIPQSADELVSALREGLRTFRAPNLRVEIKGELPVLQRLTIDLSGAHAPEAVPEKGTVTGQTFRVMQLDLQALPLRYSGASAEVKVHAQEANFEFLRSGNQDLSLAITGARTGEISVAIAKKEAEELVKNIAARAVAERGVTIDRACLTFEPSDARSGRFSAEIGAQKMFMKTIIKLKGDFQIDEHLAARLSNLKCEGAGLIGGLARGFIEPYLARFEGRAFPLASFALGDLRVTDLSMEAGDWWRVTARVGATC